MFKLVIQDDEGKTTVVPLIRDEITIGRKEGNTIRLTERNVSRRHARILRNNGEVQIEDLGSYNGIRVNNARIAERVNLRVSDQVQIGDYKLYLKAEGVEQVDDARTMPIERIDANPTDVVPAVSAAPTQPLAIPPTPAVGNGTPATPIPAIQLVGNANRTLVAVADTDPATGRPLARPEHIAAAIPQVTGFGKLVVLSSNFAGKELELSRPQMIIGRTDENDLVVNHRSISRNHAKVVREPDTQRYTISDLQSSNGVRVNGQDYGKVELRRGDVIDLGHVRLRFVEPNEDFVFARDAVITDVPETGGKKGLLVAILLGVLVLGAVVVFFVMRNGDDNKGPGPGTGTGGMAEVDAGSGQVAINPPPLIDAADIAPPPDTAAVVPTTPDREKLITRCKEARDARNWFELNTCGNDLIKAGGDGKDFVAKATMEATAESALRAVKDNIKTNFKDAQKAYASIPTGPNGSVYLKEAKDIYDPIHNDLVASTVADLNASAKGKSCTDYNRKLRTFENGYGTPIANEVRNKARKCEASVTPPPKPCDSCSKGYVCENDKCVKKTVEVPVVTSICDNAQAVADAEAKGDTNTNSGSWAAALANFESVIKCKPGLASKAYLSACHSKNFAKATTYFRMSGSKDAMAQICMKEGFDPRKP